MATPHKHAALIHAYADGAVIECRSQSTEHWTVTRTPAFLHAFEYRIKPEPKPDTHHIGYVKRNPDNGIVYIVQYSSSYGHNVGRFKYTLDGETHQLKSVELIKKD